jgi:hypothetical protein
MQVHELEDENHDMFTIAALTRGDRLAHDHRTGIVRMSREACIERCLALAEQHFSLAFGLAAYLLRYGRPAYLSSEVSL